jgi:hypothetical protein
MCSKCYECHECYVTVTEGRVEGCICECSMQLCTEVLLQVLSNTCVTTEIEGANI